MNDGDGDEQTPVAASVGRRVAARVVDGTLWAVPTIVVVNLAFADRPAGSSEAPSWYSGVSAALSLAAFAYEVLLTWRFGQTVGKRFLNIRVHRLETAAPPGLWRSAVRAVVVTALPLVLIGDWLAPGVETALDVGAGLVLLAFVLLRRDARGLHDLAARTRVVPA